MKHVHLLSAFLYVLMSCPFVCAVNNDYEARIAECDRKIEHAEKKLEQKKHIRRECIQDCNSFFGRLTGYTQRCQNLCNVQGIADYRVWSEEIDRLNHDKAAHETAQRMHAAEKTFLACIRKCSENNQQKKEKECADTCHREYQLRAYHERKTDSTDMHS